MVPSACSSIVCCARDADLLGAQRQRALRGLDGDVGIRLDGDGPVLAVDDDARRRAGSRRSRSVSSPSLSLNRITCPLRDTMTRRSLAPSVFSSGGRSLPFHRPPSTYGASGLPCSKATSTSSSTSGGKYMPRLLAGHRCRHPRPRGLDVVGHPRQRDLDPAEALAGRRCSSRGRRRRRRGDPRGPDGPSDSSKANITPRSCASSKLRLVALVDRERVGDGRDVVLAAEALPGPFDRDHAAGADLMAGRRPSPRRGCSRGRRRRTSRGRSRRPQRSTPSGTSTMAALDAPNATLAAAGPEVLPPIVVVS